MPDIPIMVYDKSLSMIIIVGGGTDGGGWGIDANGNIIPIPGWEAFRLAELRSAVQALNVVSQFKNPRLAERVAGPLAQFVQEELSSLQVG